MVLLFLFVPSSTNIDPFQVLSTMSQKQDRVYARGRSKFVAPSARLVIGSDDECDIKYVPTGTSTPSHDARASRATPKKVASGVDTATLTGRSLRIMSKIMSTRLVPILSNLSSLNQSGFVRGRIISENIMSS